MVNLGTKFGLLDWMTGRPADMLCLGLVVLTNPVLYFFNDSPYYVPPDSVAYATLGRRFFSDFLFYLPSWGHVDSGLILSPLYPLLIALGTPFTENLIGLAEWISSASLLLAGIPLYLLVRRRTGRVVALCATMAFQVSYVYGFMGLVPLTEALFILIVGCTLLALDAYLAEDRRLLGLGLGALCALAFLARQPGLIVFAFCLLWIVAAELGALRRSYRAVLRRSALVICGFLVVAGPYASVLYYQTGAHPLQRSFRMGIYEVGTDDAAVLSDIVQIQSGPVSGYADVYAQRRLMRKLLPDGSEMYSSLVGISEGPNKKGSGLTTIIKNNLTSPGEFAARFGNNLDHLKGTLGLFLLALFLVTAVTPFLIRSATPAFPRRYMMAAFSLSYLAVISLLSGFVPRYVEVLLPFVLLHAASELYVIGGKAPSIIRWRYLPTLTAVAVLALGAALMPRHFNALSVAEKAAADAYPDKPIEQDEPVFSLFPYDAHLVRGWFRTLPNDGLEKVVEYGKRTGVRWILVSKSPGALGEIRLYTHAKWYTDPHIDLRYGDLVEFCCVLGESGTALYRIKPVGGRP
jgi:4-amino-4-deoxy-L-arabinose transferase-like glycosyltransferase